MNQQKSEKISLSIIIPFYNTGENLYKRCLDSILDNDINNLEVLVIDDGSSDEGKAALNYRHDDHRLRIIYNQHSGPSAARNLGIREANGQQIMFVDSDDFLTSETFYKIASDINSYSNDVDIFSGGKFQNGKIYPNDSVLEENHNYALFSDDKNNVMQSALSIGNYPEEHIQYFSLGAPVCKLFSRDFLNKNHLKFNENIRFGEDVVFMLNVYLYADSIYYHDLFLYNYVMNSESATKKFRPGLSKDMDVFFDEIETFLKNNDLYEVLKNAFYARAEYETGHCFRSEFYHYKNTDRQLDKKFKEFCAKEPYASALKYKYLPKKRKSLKILFFLINHNLGCFYKYLSYIYFKFFM